jgi:hypothetical protein
MLLVYPSSCAAYLFACTVPITLLRCSSTKIPMWIIAAEPNAPYKVAVFGTVLVSEPPVRTAAGSLGAELAAVCPVSGLMYSRYHHPLYLCLLVMEGWRGAWPGKAAGLPFGPGPIESQAA